jgi:hypothetical protein
MRFLMRVSLPVQKFNEAVRAGTAGSTLGKILGEIKPEGAYFTTHNGQRTGYLIVNLANASEMPRLGEPFFLTFDAQVDWFPVMTPDDLQKAGLEKFATK